jgi:hypothetical protein
MLIVPSKIADVFCNETNQHAKPWEYQFCYVVGIFVFYCYISRWIEARAEI